MNLKRIYFIIGGLIVAAVAVILLMPASEPPAPGANAQLPPGHPSVGGQGATGMPGQPDKSNVRQDFVHELEMLKKKVAEAPASDTADVLKLARMLLDSHQGAESIPFFERYVAAAPKNTTALLDLSVAYYQNKQLDKALGVTRRILTYEADNTIAQYNLGALLATQQKKEEARQVWEKLIKRHPGTPDAKRAEESLKQL